ncbi:hypothetical protein HOLleu_37270 [Holothuria leucospilota]|uniref:Reverse transcriptase n=1 Tax=Holothuria leucospilota TaxID=206669 RepID=A0A9Q0YHT2_HOLLE|nr:hypothetical protein HOLleu_37270 [Holothuria leucospilota]
MVAGYVSWLFCFALHSVLLTTVHPEPLKVYYTMTTVQIELEKITQIGEKLGLKGQELKDFIQDERKRLREEKDAERVDNIDAYINRFERYALCRGWNRKKEWAINLGALLQGKALYEYSTLPTDDALDYDKVKKAVLKAYELNAEGFRKKFRNSRPEQNELGPKFAARLSNYLKRWIELSNVKSLDDFKDLIVREQFLASCSQEHAMFLKEREPKTLAEMTKLADQYLTAHGGWKNVNRRNNYARGQTRTDNGRGKFVDVSKDRRAGNKTSGMSKKPGFACFICNSPKHMARDCPNRQRLAYLSEVLDKETRETGTPEVETVNKSIIDERTIASCLITISPPHFEKAKVRGALTLKCGHKIPVLSAACGDKQGTIMPTIDGKVGPYNVKVLRDTGCSCVVVRGSLVDKSRLTDEYKVCILIDGTVRRFQVALVDIDTPYFKGVTPALCMPNPVYDLIVGNIPGARGPHDPNPTWSSHELILNPDQKECTEAVAAVQTRNQAANKDKPRSKLKVPPLLEDKISAADLRKLQEDDVSLRRLRELANSGSQKENKSGAKYRYVISEGILYREFVSPNIDFGNTLRQVVVPKKLREVVLKLAHESILGGHLGCKKTKDRITTCFTWPGIYAQVARFCQSCDKCQRTFPKGRVTKVPLGSMPIIEEPFQRVAVDLVGPIHPATTSGYRYILVLVDYATRYPEAIPLRNIDTETVAEGLLSIYSRVGFPSELLTDLGSQFVSGVMKAVSRLLSIRRLTTTPYHAMCNGLVERFNGTLKGMLRKLCEEKPSDWDRYIDPLLFAYREVPQESTGFSPFELLYGRTVRGPMDILKELWTGKTIQREGKQLYQYVLDLQERLDRTCTLAREQLEKARGRYRVYYNRKSKVRNLDVGDEVLLLLPTDENKMLMHWKGPFPVVAKVNTMNYTVDLGSRVKTFHVNMLKQYHRPEKVASLIAWQGTYAQACTAVIEEETVNASDSMKPEAELIHYPPVVQSEKVSDVNIGSQLDSDQIDEVKELLNEFADVLTDLPGCTNLGQHVIRVTEVNPVRSKPYPLPYAMKKEIQGEVDSMLKSGIISHSNSPYASPLVAVSKPDGSKRVCVDLRKINQITIFDAEPIPQQDEIFAELARDNYFTKLDLSKGYWQVPLSPESKPLTAFRTSKGLFEFNRMAFGLVNAAATFSRIMRRLLEGLDNAHNYIDDILVHTPTWEEHMIAVREVFERLRRATLTARPTKCFVGYSEVEFLGYIVGQSTLRPKLDKVESIQNAERPTTKKQVRSFLGLAGYYRRFVPNFASIAVPLTNCTKKGEPNVIVWDSSKENSFRALKARLTQSPILRLPDNSKQFILRTDASDEGIGAVLLQEFSGTKFPIAYASKKLSNCQKNYSTMEKECLAIVWAIQKFQTYLYGKEFIIETDHQPLACIRKSKVANGRIMRWALTLQPYRFRIQIIKGGDNVGADYLSRSARSQDCK